jgi:MoaA/NifB/PqqE/SkfB family radical SAM enzyme
LFVVALHGSRADIHDRITRRRGSFHQTCTAIRNLRTINKEVAAKIVLSKLNRGELLATARLARSLGVNEFCVVFPHALDFPREQFLRIVPNYMDVQGEVREVCLYAEAEGLPTTFETIPYCIVPDQPAFWKRSCDLRSATLPRREQGPLAADIDDRFDWEELRPTMKEKADSCRTCVFDPICEGPWREYVDAFGFDEFRQIPPESVAGFLATTRPPSDHMAVRMGSPTAQNS